MGQFSVAPKHIFHLVIEHSHELFKLQLIGSAPQIYCEHTLRWKHLQQVPDSCFYFYSLPTKLICVFQQEHLFKNQWLILYLHFCWKKKRVFLEPDLCLTQKIILTHFCSFHWKTAIVATTPAFLTSGLQVGSYTGICSFPWHKNKVQEMWPDGKPAHIMYALTHTVRLDVHRTENTIKYIIICSDHMVVLLSLLMDIYYYSFTKELLPAGLLKKISVFKTNHQTLMSKNYM